MGEGSKAVLALRSCVASVGPCGGEQYSERQKACWLQQPVFTIIPTTLAPSCWWEGSCFASAMPTYCHCSPGLHYCAPALLSFPALLSTVPSVACVAQVTLGLSQLSLGSRAAVSSQIPPCSARTVAQITGMLYAALSYNLTAPHSWFLHP